LEHNLNIRQACLCIGIQRCVYYYQKRINETKLQEDEMLAEQIRMIAHKHTKRGFPMIFKLLKRQGTTANRKRVYRLYSALGLSLRCKKCKQRIPDRIKEQIKVPRVANEVWMVDFMSDGLQNGKRFRTLNIIDDFNRELLDITIDVNISAYKVVEALDSVIFWRGAPKEIRVDNGSEFISHIFRLS
jgi:putative transposase